jgi:hypothetical protein
VLRRLGVMPAAPHDPGHEEQSLLTRIGMSDAVARQCTQLALSWKALVPVDVPLLTALLPTADNLEELGARTAARGLKRTRSSLGPNRAPPVCVPCPHGQPHAYADRFATRLCLLLHTRSPVPCVVGGGSRARPSRACVADLRHNKLGDEGTAKLAAGLGSACRKLRTVRLARNGITDRGGAALAAVLGDLAASKSVETLDLSLNALRDDSALGGALVKNRALTELDLSSNALRGGRSIVNALATNTKLVRCDLLFNPLDLGSASALAAAVRSSRERGVSLTLCGLPADAETVLLSRRGMRSSDAMLLAAELESAPCVRVVDLSYNKLGPDAAAAVAAALEQSKTITSLNLQSNRLAGSWLDFGDEVGEREDSGVISIAASLAQGNTLTSLDLSLNTLGEAGARAVAMAAATASPDDPLRWLHVGSGGEALPVQSLRGLAVRGEVQSSITLAGKHLDDLDAVSAPHRPLGPLRGASAPRGWIDRSWSHDRSASPLHTTNAASPPHGPP